jgi:TldD protein
MKVPLSGYLKDTKPLLKEMINHLSSDFKYVSILGTHVKGTGYSVSRSGSSISDSMWAEQGFVCRIYNGKGYSEYSFNDMTDPQAVEEAIRRTARESMDSGINPVPYPVLEEESITKSFSGEVAQDPETKSPKEIIETLTSYKDQGLAMADFLIDFRLRFDHVTTSKIFLSPKKDLEQSYIWSQGYVIPIGQNEKGIQYSYRSHSGLKGAEILEDLKGGLKEAVDEVADLLKAERLIPGEYDIICDPSMAGLIAHEAFGHGVEMDMFVKKRAKAVEYMNKRVASDKVRMHDGAAAAQQVSSYLFDDEGTLGTDTLIIEKGILKSGIADALSALKLGTVPTGNGKRESFERKAYTRMTNTFFAPGEDALEDMIKAIDKGYLLENFSSGMEDPKNWGIQCVAVLGREIIDGNLTGKIVSPVYLTGYVPDLLQAIDMVGPDLELSGSGACGKGYKEYVKTSTGGPYIKTKGRLA